MVLPFEPLALSFRGLDYYVPLPQVIRYIMGSAICHVRLRVSG